MAQTTAITIGNFDGVHLGHVRLVETARRCVGPLGTVVAVTFDPHPASILRPEAAPKRLSTFEQRKAWLKQAGADEVVSICPTREYLSQTPQQFIQQIVQQFLPRFIVEGSDFHFGKGRAGTVQTLREMQKGHGYEAVSVDPVEVTLGDQAVIRAGSSMVRWMLERGRVVDAGLLLGRSYELVATVEQGDQRGRTIGVPTINLAKTDCMLPADGIYAGAANSPEGTVFPAAISVGTKPTFGEHPRVCEAHLIGYEGPLNQYGWTARVAFHHWLRDQLFYSDVSLLIDQLKRDIASVLRRHLRHSETPLRDQSTKIAACTQ